MNNSYIMWLRHIFRSPQSLRVNFYDNYVIIIDKPLRKNEYRKLQGIIQSALQKSTDASGDIFGCVGEALSFQKQDKEN